MNDQKRRPCGVPLDCLLIRGAGRRSSAMCIEPPSRFPIMPLLTNAFDAMMLVVKICSVLSILVLILDHRGIVNKALFLSLSLITVAVAPMINDDVQGRAAPLIRPRRRGICRIIDHHGMLERRCIVPLSSPVIMRTVPWYDFSLVFDAVRRC